MTTTETCAWAITTGGLSRFIRRRSRSKFSKTSSSTGSNRSWSSVRTWPSWRTQVSYLMSKCDRLFLGFSQRKWYQKRERMNAHQVSRNQEREAAWGCACHLEASTYLAGAQHSGSKHQAIAKSAAEEDSASPDKAIGEWTTIDNQEEHGCKSEDTADAAELAQVRERSPGASTLQEDKQPRP